MPKHKDRPFSKKNSVTFKLVHRSQQDPLIADDAAPQFVLQECKSGRSAAADHTKYGVYYDDDYDYMQHLKSLDELDDEEVELMPVPAKNRAKSEQRKLMLPSSLFESAVQTPSGMLAGAVLPVGPQPDWDPDVVAAMDEDFDFDDPENQLEDDFVVQALGVGESESAAGSKSDRRTGADHQVDQVRESDDENEGDGDFFGMGEEESDEEEKRSCFTSYSMTSSVMRRNVGLSLLDQKFETLFEKEYADETETGPLDVEEIEGRVDPNHSQLMKNLIKEMREEADQRFDAKAFISQNHYYEEDECDRVNGVEIQIEEKGGRDCEERFDCQSILSTYSNLYNHPKLIYEQKVCSKSSGKVRVHPNTGIPVDSHRSGLTACNLKRLNVMNRRPGEEEESVSTALSHLSVRAKNETSEEKRRRKAQVRELRRDRRQEKKANRQAFRQEDCRQTQQSLNIRNNLSAIRLL